jgi:hypothetical protein
MRCPVDLGNPTRGALRFCKEKRDMFPCKVQTWLGLAVVLATLVAVQAPPALGQQPVAVSGFDADVIVDKDPSARVAHSYDGGAVAWFEAGAVDDEGNGHDDGVPAGQNVTSAAGSGVVYAIQPAAGNNVLRIAQTESGTLTLNTPAKYASLWVLASSGNGGGMDDVTITYDDGSSDVLPGSYDAGDWCDNNQRGAITGLGRANPIGPYGINFGYTNECSFGIYETQLAPNPAKNVVSLSFHNQHATFTNIWALSGQ